jgi:hypothetical protein
MDCLAVEDKAGAAAHLLKEGCQVPDPPDEATVAVKACRLLLAVHGQPGPGQLLLCNTRIQRWGRGQRIEENAKKGRN